MTTPTTGGEIKLGKGNKKPSAQPPVAPPQDASAKGKPKQRAGAGKKTRSPGPVSTPDNPPSDATRKARFQVQGDAAELIFKSPIGVPEVLTAEAESYGFKNVLISSGAGNSHAVAAAYRTLAERWTIADIVRTYTAPIHIVDVYGSDRGIAFYNALTKANAGKVNFRWSVIRPRVVSRDYVKYDPGMKSNYLGKFVARGEPSDFALVVDCYHDNLLEDLFDKGFERAYVIVKVFDRHAVAGQSFGTGSFLVKDSLVLEQSSRNDHVWEPHPINPWWFEKSHAILTNGVVCAWEHRRNFGDYQVFRVRFIVADETPVFNQDSQLYRSSMTRIVHKNLEAVSISSQMTKILRSYVDDNTVVEAMLGRNIFNSPWKIFLPAYEAYASTVVAQNKMQFQVGNLSRNITAMINLPVHQLFWEGMPSTLSKSTVTIDTLHFILWHTVEQELAVSQSLHDELAPSLIKTRTYKGTPSLVESSTRATILDWVVLLMKIIIFSSVGILMLYLFYWINMMTSTPAPKNLPDWVSVWYDQWRLWLSCEVFRSCGTWNWIRYQRMHVLSLSEFIQEFFGAGSWAYVAYPSPLSSWSPSSWYLFYQKGSWPVDVQSYLVRDLGLIYAVVLFPFLYYVERQFYMKVPFLFCVLALVVETTLSAHASFLSIPFRILLVSIIRYQGFAPFFGEFLHVLFDLPFSYRDVFIPATTTLVLFALLVYDARMKYERSFTARVFMDFLGGFQSMHKAVENISEDGPIIPSDNGDSVTCVPGPTELLAHSAGEPIPSTKLYGLLMPSNQMYRPWGRDNLEFAYLVRNVNRPASIAVCSCSFASKGNKCSIRREWTMLKTLIQGVWYSRYLHVHNKDDFVKQSRFEWANGFATSAKKKRSIKAVEQWMEDGIGHLHSQMFLKGDEKLAPKIDGDRTFIKPRTIVAVDPIVGAYVAPELNQVFELIKQFYSFRNPIFHTRADGTHVVIFVAIGSGKTSTKLDTWFARSLLLVAGTLFTDQGPIDLYSIIVAGDDSLIIAWEHGDTEPSFFEADQVQFDATNGCHALNFEFWTYGAFGLTPAKIDVLKASTETEVKSEDRKLFEKTPRPMTTQRHTGGNNTTSGNCITMSGGLTGGLVNGKLTSLVSYLTKLGFTSKTKITKDPSQCTFLKGWWQLAEDQSYHWVPLPSQILKLGSVLTDPVTIFPTLNPAFAWRQVCWMMAQSYGTVPSSLPILGPFLGAYKACKQQDVVPRDNTEFELHKVVVDSAFVPDRAQCLDAVCQRYEVDLTQIEELEQFFKDWQAKPTQALYDHPIVHALLKEDYM